MLDSNEPLLCLLADGWGVRVFLAMDFPFCMSLLPYIWLLAYSNHCGEDLLGFGLYFALSWRAFCIG